MPIYLTIPAANLASAARRAADWLEVNPDKHLQGTFAMTGDYTARTCDPRAPEAGCFCALGRVAAELSNEDASRLYIERGVDKYFIPGAHYIWRRNDNSKPDGILALREFAARLEQQA